jgi:hypothetical protein
LLYITSLFITMSIRYTLRAPMLYVVMLLLSVCGRIEAQTPLFNGGFETWHGGFFGPGSPSHGVECCGAALATPDGWGIPELLMAMPTNQFVFKETDTANIRTGNFSAKMLTDITMMDSAGDLADNIAVLVPGSVVCAGIIGYGSLGLQGDLYQNIAYSKGAPFADTPRALNFYMKMNHDVPDTALFAYAFTRWDSMAHREDTLASHRVDLPDGAFADGGWHLVSDTIHYTLAGLPDTLHLIFYGGRNADSTKAGNTTWLDDVSLYYAGPDGASGIVHLSADDAVSVYPNPASSTVHVTIDDYMTGSTIALYDLTGSRVMTEVLTAARSSMPITSLANGVYLYRILDRNARLVNSGKVVIEH